MILCTFIEIKMKLDVARMKNRKFLLCFKKKKEEQFDTLSGKEHDQSLFLCFSIEEVWKGDAWSDVKILRGITLDTNFRKGKSILGYASTVYP